MLCLRAEKGRKKSIVKLVKSRLFCSFMIWCALPMYIKKHLGFMGLRKVVSKGFNRIPDHRDEADYRMHDVFMGGKLPGKGWMGAGGGAVLALLVFFGIPARRRSWRQMLGVVMLLAALGCLSACGGGGSSGGGGGGGQTDPGTLAGTYTFQVQGTGTPSVTPAVSTTFTVTVN